MRFSWRYWFRWNRADWSIIGGYQQLTRVMIMPIINSDSREDKCQGVQLLGRSSSNRDQIHLEQVFTVHVVGIRMRMQVESSKAEGVFAFPTSTGMP